MGINYAYWFTFPNQNAWDKFGDMLTPKTKWSQLFAREKSKVGMSNISMKISDAVDSACPEVDSNPELNVSISPVKGTRKEDFDYCTQCILNYHFPLGKTGSIINATKTLNMYFDEIFNKGTKDVKRIVESFYE